jgi:hypothetical protein
LNAGNISSGKIDNTRLNEASTTGAGIVQLSDSTNGTSTTTAATESAVKAAYDRSSWGTGTFSDVLKLGVGVLPGTRTLKTQTKRTHIFVSVRLARVPIGLTFVKLGGIMQSNWR